MKQKPVCILTDFKDYEKKFWVEHDCYSMFDFEFLDFPISSKNVMAIRSADILCAFVNDKLDANCLKSLAEKGVKHIQLRCAGFNQVDLEAAKENNIEVSRVPRYSPHSVAEYSLGLLLNLNRKIHKAYNRTRELNFDLHGMLGVDIYGSSVGVIGTGSIGSCFAKALLGLGAKVYAYDIEKNRELEDLGVRYLGKKDLIQTSKVISLHIPLNSDTHHFLGDEEFSWMQEGTFLLNTGRGGLIDGRSLLHALKKKKIAGAALDVYEEEEGIFFKDHSLEGIDDDLLCRLISFPNVIVSSHQAYLTETSLSNICDTSYENILLAREGRKNQNFLT